MAIKIGGSKSAPSTKSVSSLKKEHMTKPETDHEIDSEDEASAPAKKTVATTKKAVPAHDPDTGEVDDDAEDEAPAAKKGGFFKYGKTAKETLARASVPPAFEFFISKKDMDKEYEITFLDGTLDEDEMFDTPSFFMHKVEGAGGRLESYIIDTDEPDVIQQSTGKKPDFCQALTILARTPFVSGDKTYQDMKKLFIMKRQTIQRLTKYAKMNKGTLVGLTFTVARSGEKSPSTGDVFMQLNKQTIPQLQEELTETHDEKRGAELVKALDYDVVLPVYSAEELVKKGVGSTGSTLKTGSVKGAKDLGDHL